MAPVPNSLRKFWKVLPKKFRYENSLASFRSLIKSGQENKEDLKKKYTVYQKNRADYLESVGELFRENRPIAVQTKTEFGQLREMFIRHRKWKGTARMPEDMNGKIKSAIQEMGEKVGLEVEFVKEKEFKKY